MTVEVSVVIACHNAEATLAVQLEALSRQDCPVPWNVVISNNRSTDRSVAIARSFAGRLPGLKIIDAFDRAGAGYARNIAAQATSAPLLAFCDADDEAAPDWLPTMVAALQQHTFVAGRFESRRLNDARTLRSRPLQQDTALQDSPFGPGLPHAGAGNLGVHRDLFLSVGGFDPLVSYLEDTDLCWRIQLAGARLVFQPAAVMHVRLRSSLSTMFGQGRAYGAASALLEKRYSAPAVAGPHSSATETGRSLDPVRVGRTLLRLARTHDSVGAWLWTVGWHVGYRQQPPPHTIPLPSMRLPNSQPAPDSARDHEPSD